MTEDNTNQVGFKTKIPNKDVTAIQILVVTNNIFSLKNWHGKNFYSFV